MSEEKRAEAWVKANKGRVLSDAQAGNAQAQAIIDVHRMLVAHADAPTWGVFIGAVDTYRRLLGGNDG